MPTRLPRLAGLLLTLLAGAAALAPALPVAAQDPDPEEPALREYVHEDTQSTRLKTDAMYEADPPCLRVTNMHWDCPFRETGLRLGDRIIKVDGETVDPPDKLEDLQRWLPRQVGAYAEYQAWVEAGKGEGTPVTLTVRRRRVPGEGWEEHEFTASLVCERSWSVGRNRLIGPNGPNRMKNDGFYGAWAGWEEKYQRHIWSVLDGGFFHRRFDNRRELKKHLEDHKPRVDFLVKNHPGPFAKAMKADWDRAYEVLQGTKYELTEDDLAYRQLGEKRAAEIKEAGEAARAEWLEKHADDIIEPWPMVDPITGDRAGVTGKFVVLPDIARNWASEPGDINWAVVRGSGRDAGTYFVNAHDDASQRMFNAAWRYAKLISPRIDPTRLAVIGRIQPDPRMVTANGRTVTGLEVQMAAATVNDRFFIDLTTTTGDGQSQFAGEELLKSPDSAMPADDASPKEVMEAYIAAVKAADEQTFKALYADWRIVEFGSSGRKLWYPSYNYPLDRTFVKARRLITERAYGARVVWVSDIHTVCDEGDFEDAPRIERVIVELDHIGLFDGEYRSFINVYVKRTRALERVNGGPWRIADGTDF